MGSTTPPPPMAGARDQSLSLTCCKAHVCQHFGHGTNAGTCVDAATLAQVPVVLLLRQLSLVTAGVVLGRGKVGGRLEQGVGSSGGRSAWAGEWILDPR